MPLITSVPEFLSDRLILHTRNQGDVTVLYSDIPQVAINQGAAAIETWFNTRLNDPVRNLAVSPTEGRRFNIAVRVVTLDPLMLTSMTWNVGMPQPSWDA